MVSEKCKIVLERGLTKEDCLDFRKIRSWVMCNAWKIMEERRTPFRSAIKQSWVEAKEACIKLGAY